MVAPAAADVEVVPGEADELEAILLEHALRRDVADQRPRLEAMEAKRSEGVLDDRGDGARREPTPVPLRVHPVAEVGASEGAVDDVRERDRPERLRRQHAE